MVTGDRIWQIESVMIEESVVRHLRKSWRHFFVEVMYIFIRWFALDLMQTNGNICSEVILQGVRDWAKWCVQAATFYGNTVTVSSSMAQEAKALTFCYGFDKQSVPSWFGNEFLLLVNVNISKLLHRLLYTGVIGGDSVIWKRKCKSYGRNITIKRLVIDAS